MLMKALQRLLVFRIKTAVATRTVDKRTDGYYCTVSYNNLSLVIIVILLFHKG
jgi:hypothetical protein